MTHLRRHPKEAKGTPKRVAFAFSCMRGFEKRPGLSMSEPRDNLDDWLSAYLLWSVDLEALADTPEGIGNREAAR